MSWEHDREMTLVDGRDVLVEYTVESLGSEPSGLGGLPEDYDPGSGPELYITKITLSLPRPDDLEEQRKWLNCEPPFDDETLKVEISDEERDRLEGVIAENPDWWMPDFDDYYPEDY